MGLFTRKINTKTDVAALYSVGQKNTMLIVGLGNIGKDYEGTRHNAGFMCVDHFAKANEFTHWEQKKDLKAMVTSGMIGATRVLLMKPTTFMNNSGSAVQAVAAFYKLSTKEIIVVHDELDIPFGQLKTKVGGGTAGHNGLKSLVEHLGEDFGRLRVGIGPKTPEQMDSADFVLAKFNKDEISKINELCRETTALLTEIVVDGSVKAETRTFL